MTGPAIDFINFIFPDKEQATTGEKLYRILISFGPAEKGRKLLRLADQITHKENHQTDITAFHLTPSSDINPKEASEYERESFRPVKNEAEQLSISIKTLYKATNDIRKEITTVANKGKYDLLLVGGNRSLFTDDVTGGKVRTYLEDTNCQVGVLVDKDFSVADTIFIPILDSKDFFLVSFAERFIQNNQAKVQLMDMTGAIEENVIFKVALDKINANDQGSASIVKNATLKKEFLKQFDLMVISYDHWSTLSKNKASWLAFVPSVLIIKPQL
jgi:hypothetical protein